jgi:SAM-dependent methyltransferase
MSCPICNEHRFWPIPFADDPDVAHWQADAGGVAAYEWRLCRRCGNAYPSQQPDIQVLQRLWPSKRSDATLTPEAKEAAWEYRRRISRAGAVRSFRLFAPLARNSGGRFIDIGCGLGETVRIFAAHGWDAEGIDADSSTAPLHQELGIRVRIGQLEQADIGTGYDVIHIAHAIYFITDPMGFLRRVHGSLTPGGLFCIVLADFLASADPALPGYVHTFFPTASSMRYALALAGFEVVLGRKRSGSIFIAAQPTSKAVLPSVWPAAILALYRTKALRYRLFGRPYLALRSAIKQLMAPVLKDRANLR